jgi:hypothetical protein
MSSQPINPKTLKTLLTLLFVFNVFDGLATLFFLENNLAEEMNPIMNWAFSKSTELFLAIKIVWIGINIGILWFSRKSILVHATWILFAIFTCLFIYETVFFVMSFGARF